MNGAIDKYFSFPIVPGGDSTLANMQFNSMSFLPFRFTVDRGNLYTIYKPYDMCLHRVRIYCFAARSRTVAIVANALIGSSGIGSTGPNALISAWSGSASAARRSSKNCCSVMMISTGCCLVISGFSAALAINCLHKIARTRAMQSLCGCTCVCGVMIGNCMSWWCACGMGKLAFSMSATSACVNTGTA